METKELINSLVAEATPVQRLSKTSRRLMKWAFAALLCLGAGLAVFGVRPDVWECMGQASFLMRGVLLLSLATLSAAAAFTLSVPGLDRGPLTRILPVVTLVAWALLLGIGFFVGGHPLKIGVGFICVRDIFLLGFGPGVLLFWMIRRAAPLSLGWSGVMIMLAAGALGAFGRQFSCANDNPLYLLIWHFVPVLLLGICGVFLGRYLIKREKQPPSV